MHARWCKSGAHEPEISDSLSVDFCTIVQPIGTHSSVSVRILRCNRESQIPLPV